MIVVHDVSSHSCDVSTTEQWFLDTYHAVGPVGVLVLKSLAYLIMKGRADSVQISRETLACHCDRSIRTISRAVTKLKTLSLIEAEQPSPRGFDCWESNVYRLTALGRHVAALLGTSPLSADFSAWDMSGLLVFSQSNSRSNSSQTSAPPVSRPNKPTEFSAAPASVPSCGQDLEPVVHALEQADRRRYAHLRDWVLTKLRAGISRRHLKEALEALSVNLERVSSWAGWIQNRLEDMAKAERIAEQRRQAAIEQERRWRAKWKDWEVERERNSYRPGDLGHLQHEELNTRRAGAAPT
jgi:DNA-binding transcriptional ArsR family regulator